MASTVYIIPAERKSLLVKFNSHHYFNNAIFKNKNFWKYLTLIIENYWTFFDVIQKDYFTQTQVLFLGVELKKLTNACEN